MENKNSVLKDLKYFTDETLKNWGFFPGNYISKCEKCKSNFIGDKRCTVCYSCAKKGKDRYEKHKKLQEILDD